MELAVGRGHDFLHTDNIEIMGLEETDETAFDLSQPGVELEDFHEFMICEKK